MFHFVSYNWFRRIQYIPSFDLIYNGVGKIVEEICTRIDGCRIIDNVCLDCEIV